MWYGKGNKNRQHVETQKKRSLARILSMTREPLRSHFTGEISKGFVFMPKISQNWFVWQYSYKLVG